MGKVILVSDGLTEQMIRAGESVVNRLDSLPVIVDDVFWYRRSEEVEWKLVLTMPGLSFYGPLVGYGHVQSLLLSISDSDDVLIPNLDQITLLDTNAAPVQALRHSLKAPFQRSHYAMNRVWLDRVYFEGVYVYQLANTVPITCDLLIDSKISSSLEGHTIREGNAYVAAGGSLNVPEGTIIAHGKIQNGTPLKITIEMPPKYGIDSCNGLNCHAVMTTTHDGLEQPPTVDITLVKLTQTS